MAVYYLGNPAEKRKRLVGSRDAVYLDNDDVLASYFKSDKYYFIIGRTPFADFNVWEYLSYTKSLELRRPLRMDEARELLSRTGFEINLKKKLKRLDPVSLKAVKLAAALRPDTTKICFNLDGVSYSRYCYKKLQTLVSNLCDYQIIISVSDIKFVPKEGAIEWFLDSPAIARKIKIKKESKRASRLS